MVARSFDLNLDFICVANLTEHFCIFVFFLSATFCGYYKKTSFLTKRVRLHDVWYIHFRPNVTTVDICWYHIFSFTCYHLSFTYSLKFQNKWLLRKLICYYGQKCRTQHFVIFIQLVAFTVHKSMVCRDLTLDLELILHDILKLNIFSIQSFFLFPTFLKNC